MKTDISNRPGYISICKASLQPLKAPCSDLIENSSTIHALEGGKAGTKGHS